MNHTSDTARFTSKPAIIATDLENELVLLDPETQEMFRLNPTGRLVWLSLPSHDMAGIVRQIVESFDVTPEQAARDVRAVLAELQAAGLIAGA